MRSPSLWMDDLSIGRKTTRLQPLPDEPSRRPVVDAQTEHLHQLVMVQMVEKAFYIGFDYVTIPSLLQIKGQVSNRIQPTVHALGDTHNCNLRNPLHKLPSTASHRPSEPVCPQALGSQWPFLSVLLRNVRPPYQLGPIALQFQSLRQRLNIGLKVLFIGRRRHPIDPTGRILIQILPAVH